MSSLIKENNKRGDAFERWRRDYPDEVSDVYECIGWLYPAMSLRGDSEIKDALKDLSIHGHEDVRDDLQHLIDDNDLNGFNHYLLDLKDARHAEYKEMKKKVEDEEVGSIGPTVCLSGLNTSTDPNERRYQVLMEYLGEFSITHYYFSDTAKPINIIDIPEKAIKFIKDIKRDRDGKFIGYEFHSIEDMLRFL